MADAWDRAGAHLGHAHELPVRRAYVPLFKAM